MRCSVRVDSHYGSVRSSSAGISVRDVVLKDLPVGPGEEDVATAFSVASGHLPKPLRATSGNGDIAVLDAGRHRAILLRANRSRRHFRSDVDRQVRRVRLIPRARIFPGARGEESTIECSNRAGQQNFPRREYRHCRPSIGFGGVPIKRRG